MLPGVDVVHDLLDFPCPFPDQEIDSRWQVKIRCSHVTALDWKQRHVRRVDEFIGRIMHAWLNRLLRYPHHIPVPPT